MSALRAEMVVRIRADLRAATPAADDAEFERVLLTIGRIPRDAFVPAAVRSRAYGNTPLPIGYDQTISDAYIVAVMTAAARIPAGANVLDIGTGSGYQAAVLAERSRHVVSIEIVRPLADRAAKRLAKLGYLNIEVHAGDGFVGWQPRAPYDAIIVAAGAASIPEPLIAQLRAGGRLVMPIGPSTAQEQLIVLSKAADGKVTRCSLGWAMFVPFTGAGARAPDTRGLMDRTVPLCFGAQIT